MIILYFIFYFLLLHKIESRNVQERSSFRREKVQILASAAYLHSPKYKLILEQWIAAEIQLKKFTINIKKNRNCLHQEEEHK